MDLVLSFFNTDLDFFGVSAGSWLRTLLRLGVFLRDGDTTAGVDSTSTDGSSGMIPIISS